MFTTADKKDIAKCSHFTEWFEIDQKQQESH